MDSKATCEHCGGMVGEDGLAILLPEEPKEETEQADAAEKLSFADAIAKREGK